MENDALKKVLAISGGSMVGALATSAVVGDSTPAIAVGSGLMAGVVKGNWNIMHAQDSATSKDTSLPSFLNIPWMCAARIGGLTALIYSVMEYKGNPKQALAVAAWLGGASELFVPKTSTT
jgi:hypothetical protein